MNATLNPLGSLARAEAADPGNTFVAGCRSSYERTGRLSEKQLASLARVTRTRRRSLDLATPRSIIGPDGFVEPDDADSYGLDQSWDWAGGD